MKTIITMGMIIALFIVNSLSFAGQVGETITRVENQKVCMVNDTYFGKNQIPVKVGSKIYYGCCKNCEKTLKENASYRSALDPQTGKKVDKASALIATDSTGKALYFENKNSFELYQKKKKHHKKHK